MPPASLYDLCVILERGKAAASLQAVSSASHATLFCVVVSDTGVEAVQNADPGDLDDAAPVPSPLGGMAAASVIGDSVVPCARAASDETDSKNAAIAQQHPILPNV